MVMISTDDCVYTYREEPQGHTVQIFSETRQAEL